MERDLIGILGLRREIVPSTPQRESSRKSLDASRELVGKFVPARFTGHYLSNAPSDRGWIRSSAAATFHVKPGRATPSAILVTGPPGYEPQVSQPRRA